jgi:dinuclear metal center YbgI/SA1388 family protein
MKIKNIIDTIEQLAPPSYQESYDNAGLIVGDASADCTGVLISLDCTEAVVAEAIEKGCNLIVAHHPIVFSGLKRFNSKNYVERTVMLAIKHDVAIYAAHTNVDNMLAQGVNSMICEKLGLTQTKILAPKTDTLLHLSFFVPYDASEEVRQALFNIGAGAIGQYSECSFNSIGMGTFKPSALAEPTIGTAGKRENLAETKVEILVPKHLQKLAVETLFKAHPYEEIAYYITPVINENQEIGAGMFGLLENPMPVADFLNFVKETIDLKVIKHTNLCKNNIKTVAVCGGAGSFLLGKAKSVQADVFITSDFKYHEFFDAENKVIIADIGHYESEFFTIQLFFEIISKKFPNFAVSKTESSTNPVFYF